jgi:cyclic beta-1,2-glucan synthetase
MERLPRYAGHFFNWYDTQTLAPLDPLFVSTVDSGNLAACLWTLKQGCLDLRSQIPEGERLDELAAKAGALVQEMDFGLVYNSKRKTLSVGYDVNANRQDTACYDLLASEARMASFIAIAKNDVPLESWFHLGRAHTRFLGRRILLSWTGTMFEYLLPSLWMRVFPNTILEKSLHAAIGCQRSIGRRDHTPWGISEAAYCVTDQDGNYQYRAFGVSELAIKTGISGAVIAPYASALALGMSPTAAIRNMRKMEQMGWTGTYGFFDSADFHNPEQAAVVRAWMAHHQGMILLAVANALTGSAMQRRFHAEPFVKANELILDEKAPSSGPCDVPVPEDRARATAVPGYDSVDI